MKKTKGDIINLAFIKHPKLDGEEVVLTLNQVLWCMETYADQRIKRYNRTSSSDMLEDIKRFSEELSTDRNKAKQFFYDTWIYDENGNLTENFVVELSGIVPHSRL